jgi:hypothetical protein
MDGIHVPMWNGWYIKFLTVLGRLPVVVFFGDDVQLPPVLDSPVYICKSQIPAAIHGVLVWKEFTHAVALRTVVRQGNDENTFKQILTDLRQYYGSTFRHD